MGVITYEKEIQMSVSPTRLFKGYILNADNIIRKIVPHAIKAIEILEGDGHSVGTVRVVNWGTGTGVVKCSMQRFDVIDEENRVFQYTVLEGEDFDEFVDSFTRVWKVEPNPDGGSVLKIIETFHTKGDNHDAVIKEMNNQLMDEVEDLLKAVDAYLQAHPDKYN